MCPAVHAICPDGSTAAGTGSSSSWRAGSAGELDIPRQPCCWSLACSSYSQLASAPCLIYVHASALMLCKDAASTDHMLAACRAGSRCHIKPPQNSPLQCRDCDSSAPDNHSQAHPDARPPCSQCSQDGEVPSHQHCHLDVRHCDSPSQGGLCPQGSTACHHRQGASGRSVTICSPIGRLLHPPSHNLLIFQRQHCLPAPSSRSATVCSLIGETMHLPSPAGTGVPPITGSTACQHCPVPGPWNALHSALSGQGAKHLSAGSTPQLGRSLLSHQL